MKRARLGEMRLRGRWNNSSAQALLELAIFGSLILFCLGLLLQYGLRSNYQDFLRMTTFRRALTLAVNRSQLNATNQYSPGVNFSVLWDKSIPNPQDRFEVKERFPYGAGNYVIYTNKLYRGLVAERLSEDPNPRRYLPGTDIIINEGDDKFGRGGNPGWLHPADIIIPSPLPGNHIAMDTQPGYTTEGVFLLEDHCNKEKSYRKKISKYYPGSPGLVWWEWKEGITCDTKDENGQHYIREGASLDVDDDYVEETVIGEKQECQQVYIDELGYSVEKCEVVGCYMLDPNLGDIDPAYGRIVAVVLNGKPTKVVQKYKQDGIEISQGIQPGYRKYQAVFPMQDNELNTYDIKLETPQKIRNERGTHAFEAIQRRVLLNDKKRNNEPPEELKENYAVSAFEQEEQRSWQTPF